MRLWPPSAAGGPLRKQLLALAATAAALTVLSSAKLGLRPLPGQVAITTSAALVGVLAAVLLLGRAASSGRSSDLFVLGSLVALGTTNIAFSLVPLLWDTRAGAGWLLAGLAGRAGAGGALVLAAWLPDRHVACAQAVGRRVTLGAVSVVLVLGFLIVGLVELASARSLVSGSVDSAGRVTGEGTALVAAQLSLLLLQTAAAIGLARRYRRTGDHLLSWIASFAGLSALARLTYLAVPALTPTWLSVGDGLRLASWLALLAGIAQEIRQYQRRLTAEAVFEERRRLARDLHDGLAQDLAYIRLQSTQGARESSESRQLERIARTAQRALDESRLAIAALARPSDEALARALADVAAEAAQVSDAQVCVDVPEGLVVAASAREALLRVTREAVGNAVRHGRAEHVDVEVRRDQKLLLRITDDGAGFDPDARPRVGAFGLTSMRERVERLGGCLTVWSRPGSGTRVEAMLP